MFSCLQILEAFLWFVLITLLNVTLIILTLSVSRRSEERFSRNAETDLVCRLLLEKKKKNEEKIPFGGWGAGLEGVRTHSPTEFGVHGHLTLPACDDSICVTQD